MTYKPLKNPADAFLVHMHEEWEIIYWCRKFGCTRAELQQAVETIGNDPQNVRSYFLRRMRNTGT